MLDILEKESILLYGMTYLVYLEEGHISINSG